MDLTTVVGLVFGIAALVVGYMWDGGHLNALMVPSAMLIVFGGTFGAVAMSFPISRLKQIPQAIAMRIAPDAP